MFFGSEFTPLAFFFSCYRAFCVVSYVHHTAFPYLIVHINVLTFHCMHYCFKQLQNKVNRLIGIW